jgi:hypothetical protein
MIINKVGTTGCCSGGDSNSTRTSKELTYTILVPSKREREREREGKGSGSEEAKRNFFGRSERHFISEGEKVHFGRHPSATRSSLWKGNSESERVA